MLRYALVSSFFFFTRPSPTEIYTLSLHDALPICDAPRRGGRATDRGHLVRPPQGGADRKSTRLNSSHVAISYAVFCLKKKNKKPAQTDLRTTCSQPVESPPLSPALSDSQYPLRVV